MQTNNKKDTSIQNQVKKKTGKMFPVVCIFVKDT